LKEKINNTIFNTRDVRAWWNARASRVQGAGFCIHINLHEKD